MPADLIKNYNIGTDNFRFEFTYRSAYRPSDFEIISLGEKEMGFEDSDELIVYPSTIEFIITDFEWKNFNAFKRAKSAYGQGYGYFDWEPMKIAIYKNNALWFSGVISEVEMKVDEYTVAVTLTSACEKLKDVRIDNPYLIERLVNLGHLEGERLKNNAGTDWDGWAFGAIGGWGHQLLSGFVVRPYSSDDHRGVLSLTVYEDNVPLDSNTEKRIGKAKVTDVIKECIKFLNPNINLTIKHNWTFGTHNKTIEDLYFYEVYKYLFGRLMIVRRYVYDALHPNIFYDSGLADNVEMVWKDANWVAWKVNNPGSSMTGHPERSIMGVLKDIARNFYSRIAFKDIENVTLFKKGFFDVKEITEGNLIPPARKYSQTNALKYLKIDWKNRYSAVRGTDVPGLKNEEKLEYRVMFSAANSTSSGIIIQGFGGFPGGLNVFFTINNGNLFYYHEGNRYISISTKDPAVDLTKLIEIIAELEWATKNKDRESFDFELSGVNYSFDDIYKLPFNNNIYSTVQVLSMKINETENKTKISGTEII